MEYGKYRGDFLKYREPEIDKAELKKYIKLCIDIEEDEDEMPKGARIVEKQNLQIR